MLKKYSCIQLLFVLVASALHAQNNELRVYGFSQTQFDYWKGNTTVTVPNPQNSTSTIDLKNNIERNGFMMVQTNILFSKNLDDNTSIFVNAEYTRNADAERNFGSVNLREAWVNFYVNELLSVKAGTMLPRFNRLSEIRNRVPLFNYNYRPVVYEEAVRNLADGQTFVPDFANFMVHGKHSVGLSSEFVYAAYVGNSDLNFLSRVNSQENLVTSGVDTTNYILVGGRVGFNTSSIKFGDLSVGFSGTYDNKAKYISSSDIATINAIGVQVENIGAVPRIRLGYDFFYQLNSWQIESEGIYLKFNPSDKQKTQFDILQNVPFPFTEFTNNYTGSYWYSALTKSFNNAFLTAKLERLHADYNNLNSNPVWLHSYTIGYRFDNSVVTRFETFFNKGRASDAFRIDNVFYSFSIGFTF